MNDYGKPYRQAFLNELNRERRQDRNTRLLLIAAAIYMGGHVAYYLINLFMEAV